MLKQRAWFILLLIILLMITACFTVFAADLKIYLNGKNITSKFDPVKKDGQVLVQARTLAKSLQLEIKWIESIKTLEIKKDDQKLKMMAGSSYLQTGQKTIKAGTEMAVKNGHTYIPLREVVKVLGYVVDYDQKSNSFYILSPRSVISKVKWQKEGQEIVIGMNKISPYRIKKTDDKGKIIIELDKAILASNFTENISNENFYFEINRVENRACLQLVINSKYPLPFQRDWGIEEEGNNIILKFLPQIKTVAWGKDNQLKIKANGEIKKPEISFLQNPRRMVVDIPALRLAQYELNFKANKWVKDVRVSQFKYDPLILRMVLELETGKHLNLVQNNNDNMLLFKPVQRTQVNKLSYNRNEISFYSDQSVQPDIFALHNPERLVIDIYNARRGDDFPEVIKVNSKLINKIRSSRFKEEVVRLVLDLNEMTGYDVKQVKSTDGKYKHKIILRNKFRSIAINNQSHYTNLNINLSGKVNYTVKKFSYPDRIAVDFKGVENDFQSLDLPEPEGIIKDIRTREYNVKGEEINRIVFELSKFYSYDIISDNPDDTINIALARNKIKKVKNLIVVDAGHGGFDPGAIGVTGLEEKVVNLDIARRVKKLLINSNYNVILTRKKDKFISLKKRVEFANQKDARLFVSIHCNSSRGFSEGTEAFLAPGKTGDSLSLAEAIHGKLIEELELKNRGIKKENFYVIKYTEMPAVLIEVAFLSNSHEESLLGNELFRERAASAITEGIINYMRKFKE